VQRLEGGPQPTNLRQMADALGIAEGEAQGVNKNQLMGRIDAELKALGFNPRDHPLPEAAGGVLSIAQVVSVLTEVATKTFEL
jgi:hypothetical protein